MAGDAGAASSERGIVTLASPRDFDATLERLLWLIEDRSLSLFAVVDHSGEAGRVGLEMRETKLVVFGSPVAGTPVMVAQPLAALDLPLKILLWTDEDGRVLVSYNAPAYLAARHHLTEDLETRLTGVEALAAALLEEE